MMTSSPPPSSTFCPPNPIYKDPSSTSHIPLKAPFDDKWWWSTTHFIFTFQTHGAWAHLYNNSPTPTTYCVNREHESRTESIPYASTARSSNLKGMSGSSVCSKRAHNWHASCLIKGESTGMDPLSQILAFIRMACKQKHTQRQLKALLITVFCSQAAN